MSALPHPAPEVVSPETYLEREGTAPFRSEYIDGRVFAMGGASPNHNQVVVNLTTALGLFFRTRACTNYASDLRVGVQSGAAYLYPDIVITCGPEQFLPTQPPTLLNPLAIVEVLSPSTEARDRGEKFLQYQTIASLREYVLVSQWPRRFESFLKLEDGVWTYRAFREDPTALEIASVPCVIPAEDVYNKVRAESV